MWRRRADREGSELVAECEAFLSGRFARYRDGRGQDVPAWAWSNFLAHGRLEDLQKVTSSLGSPRHRYLPNGEWWEAQSYLAGEVLQRVGDSADSLHQLQLRVLIPLELRLAAVDNRVRLKPSHLVAIVLTALGKDVKNRQSPPKISKVRRDPPPSL